MKSIGCTIGVALLLFTVGATSALAHHSYAMFDHDKQVTLSGTVSRFDWSNPHINVELEVPNGSESAHWIIAGGSPNQLVRQGWSRKSLSPGDKVSIVINPTRAGDNRGWLVRCDLPNGQSLKD